MYLYLPNSGNSWFSSSERYPLLRLLFSGLPLPLTGVAFCVNLFLKQVLSVEFTGLSKGVNTQLLASSSQSVNFCLFLGVSNFSVLLNFGGLYSGAEKKLQI